MCVIDCIGCSHRPVAVPSYNGNECTSGQIQATNPKIPGPAIMAFPNSDPMKDEEASSSSFIGSELGKAIVGSVVGIVCVGILVALFCLRRGSTSNSNSSGHSNQPTPDKAASLGHTLADSLTFNDVHVISG